MKKSIISLTFLLCLASIFLFSCTEKYYKIDTEFYKDKTVAVRNPMIGDTLRIEQYNTDQIMLMEPNNPDIVFDNRGFIFDVENENILTIGEDGSIQPLAKGVTKVNIIFRADSRVATTIYIDIYEDYHPVESIMVPSYVKNQLIEKGFTFDIAPYVLVFPGYATNQTLHFSLDDASKDFASITDAGVVTGIQSDSIQIHIVSDDNPNITATFKMRVVDEILITDVILNSKLNNITLGVGEKINLNAATWVLPSNVNVINRRLNFEILDGDGVVSIDTATNTLTALSGGSSLIQVTSKNGISKQFTVNVDAAKKDLTSALWTISTSILYSTGNGYVLDGTTGSPYDMLDESSTATYLSLTKPGKTYNNCASPAGTYLYFVVDMQFPYKFNSIRWNHRTTNNYVYLRIWGISVEGSNDGENWDTISDNIRIPNTYELSANDINSNVQDLARHDLALPGTFEYRYVKVTITNWSDNSGGSTSGSTLNVAIFGLSMF